ncbi:MAG: hypothetical protein QOE45_1352 [Frankiaceae bacterium]|jgi:hypothetical protein|nr:hypothetical protein [Frankiaceae bacterium]
MRTLVATALVAAALTACATGKSPGVATARSGSPTPSADSAATAQRYIECMRGEGVPMLDELTPDEGLPQIDKEKAPFERVGSAMEHCRALLPAGKPAPRPAAADVEKLRQYASCLRAHGLPDYPDPDPDTGVPMMSDELRVRLKNDPNLPAAMKTCYETGPHPTGGVVGG